jgi:DNA-binding transcriptional MerR regulator
MSEEVVQTQSVYGSSDIADTLKIQESTLRKYCLLLEKVGYEFLKNEHGHRAFFDHDVIVLRKMISLKSSADMTLEEAAKSVVAWKNGNDITVSDTEEKRYITRYNDLLEEFKSFQEQQMNFNKELIQEIRNQQEYIEDRLEQRDRLLMQSMRETLETRKEIAAASEKKWWHFWK